MTQLSIAYVGLLRRRFGRPCFAVNALQPLVFGSPPLCSSQNSTRALRLGLAIDNTVRPYCIIYGLAGVQTTLRGDMGMR